MSKVIKQFFCNSCGHNSPKWEGKCPSCGAWNSLHEEVVQKSSSREEGKKIWRPQSGIGSTQAKMIHIDQVQSNRTLRMKTVDEELNRVLGGGIVNGSLILVGGEPGIGKSTLMLQVAMQFEGKVLYVSGEESEEQIKMRADRIMQRRSDCYLLSDTNLTQILVQAAELRPSLIIIDSIQTIQSQFVDSAPGSVSQVRESAAEIQRFAKEMHIPVFIIGHVTKDGTIAGPKLLEHIVDVVLQFEGDNHYTHRILRTIKNRFGSTAELGIYEMQSSGLREVSNPSELLISQKDKNLSGSAISATMEGIRPMLIETQALVSSSVYSAAQRSSTGFDQKRLSMLLAVLEKRCGIQFSGSDVFLNIAGGIKVSDPGIDMAVLAALVSSLEDIPIDAHLCFAGEIGLSGEVRSIQRLELRIQEAARLGFKQIFVSKFNLKGIDSKKYNIQITPISRIEELYQWLFG